MSHGVSGPDVTMGGHPADSRAGDDAGPGIKADERMFLKREQ